MCNKYPTAVDMTYWMVNISQWRDGKWYDNGCEKDYDGDGT